MLPVVRAAHEDALHPGREALVLERSGPDGVLGVVAHRDDVEVVAVAGEGLDQAGVGGLERQGDGEGVELPHPRQVEVRQHRRPRQVALHDPVDAEHHVVGGERLTVVEADPLLDPHRPARGGAVRGDLLGEREHRSHLRVVGDQGVVELEDPCEVDVVDPLLGVEGVRGRPTREPGGEPSSPFGGRRRRRPRGGGAAGPARVRRCAGAPAGVEEDAGAGGGDAEQEAASAQG